MSTDFKTRLDVDATMEEVTTAETIILTEDLQDWLDFTNYHNTSFRAKKLAYHRTSRIARQKRADLELEEQRLQQYERKYSCLSQDTGNSAESAHTESHSYDEITAGAFGGLINDNNYLNGASSPRPLWGSCGNKPDLRAGPTQSDGRGRSHSPTSSSHKTGWPHAQRQESYRSRRSSLFKPVHLGKAGDTRFFVIRSYNIENIEDSMNNGIWASKHENAKKLCEVFGSGVNVILIFGANGSHEFQGYARMTGTPSRDNYKPQWYKKIKWPISAPYTVEWISKRGIRDSPCQNLKNSLNDDLPPTRSRDCQELDDYCGRAMIDMFNEAAEDAL